MSRRAGYTLIEVVIGLALFGILTFVLLSVTMEMANHERKLKIDFLRHPQIIAVIARLRRDVLDAHGDNPYGASAPGYTNTPRTLVLERLMENAGVETVVWDFSTPGVVVRRAFRITDSDTWTARGVPPDFTANINSAINPNPKGIVGVRFVAIDKNGQVSIDQTFYPRRTN